MIELFVLLGLAAVGSLTGLLDGTSTEDTSESDGEPDAIDKGAGDPDDLLTAKTAALSKAAEAGEPALAEELAGVEPDPSELFETGEPVATATLEAFDPAEDQVALLVPEDHSGPGDVTFETVEGEGTAILLDGQHILTVTGAPGTLTADHVFLVTAPRGA